MKKITFLLALIFSTLAFSQTVYKEKSNDTEKIEEIVDSQAAFPGGLNAFRQIFADRLSTKVLNNLHGSARTEVRFMIEKDVSISEINATGSNATLNNEAIKAVKSIKSKWIPAKYKGAPVRVRFRLPISMQME